MIKIAICDDDKNFSMTLEDIIEKASLELSFNFYISCYTQGESLLEDLEVNKHIDLLFLDNNLLTTTGVIVGNKIREHLKNYRLAIVFVSNNVCKDIEIFNAKPFGYLMKPIQYKQFMQIIKQYLYSINYDNRKYFTYKHKGKEEKLDCNDIIMFSSKNRKIIINTSNGCVEFYGKINTVEKQLDDKNYIRVHQSHIVNLKYITDSKYDQIQMANGIGVNVSQKYRANVKDKLYKYKKRSKCK